MKSVNRAVCYEPGRFCNLGKNAPLYAREKLIYSAEPMCPTAPLGLLVREGEKFPHFRFVVSFLAAAIRRRIELWRRAESGRPRASGRVARRVQAQSSRAKLRQSARVDVASCDT
jgi:hypothetical protein